MGVGVRIDEYWALSQSESVRDGRRRPIWVLGVVVPILTSDKGFSECFVLYEKYLWCCGTIEASVLELIIIFEVHKEESSESRFLVHNFLLDW